MKESPPFRLGWSATALWAAVVLLWMLAVGGHQAPAALCRLAVVAAVLSAAAWLAVRISRSSPAGLLLATLLVVSLAVRFIGLSHEVEGRYYLDEGTYYHHASEIDAGRWLRLSFVYPHFLYYADALALWIAGLFPGVVAGVAAAIGVTDPLGVSWLVLRALVALLSAFTVVPVFLIARRIGGVQAGVTASLLLAFSPLFNDGSHLNTCDVPSAVFATVCLLFVARLIDEERTSDYLLAGVAAGLAAGSKYPAGVVAVAIVAVWVRWRIARRDLRPGLLWAGLAALATFVAVMPSLVVFPEAAFLGNRGIFFGSRQYGKGGWLGVMPGNNGFFYARQMARSFGLPALLVGLSGLLFTPRGERHRWLWLAPFPGVYLVLISSMNMVVKRNLYPVVPAVAVFLGIGTAAWLRWLGERLPRPAARATVTAALALACLALPLRETVVQAVSLARRGTREQAAAWIASNVPAGASIAKESYTPDFPAGRYRVFHRRFVTRLSLDELRGFDYVLVASSAYLRFADPAALTRQHQREMAERYARMFKTFELVHEWRPAEMQAGPVLRLYRPR